MNTKAAWWAVAVTLAMAVPCAAEERVLFEDHFEQRLSSQWQVVGLKPEDYRVRNGGLELRVQPGEVSKTTPLLKVILPASVSESVVASVQVTLLDAFTEEHETAGLYLIDEDGPEFGGRQERLEGKLVFAPGVAKFVGHAGEEGDVKKYLPRYTEATPEAGSLRIVIRGEYATFQVGPSPQGKYLNFFESAVHPKAKERGFALIAAGTPKDAEHWVRFEHVRITKL